MNLVFKTDCCSKRRTAFLFTNKEEQKTLRELLNFLKNNEKTRVVISQEKDSLVFDTDSNTIIFKRV